MDLQQGDETETQTYAAYTFDTQNSFDPYEYTCSPQSWHDLESTQVLRPCSSLLVCLVSRAFYLPARVNHQVERIDLLSLDSTKDPVVSFVTLEGSQRGRRLLLLVLMRSDTSTPSFHRALWRKGIRRIAVRSSKHSHHIWSCPHLRHVTRVIRGGLRPIGVLEFFGVKDTRVNVEFFIFLRSRRFPASLE